MLNQQLALYSIVWMIAFVLTFDRVHRRKRHYRQLWEMYKAVVEGGRAAVALPD